MNLEGEVLFFFFFFFWEKREDYTGHDDGSTFTMQNMHYFEWLRQQKLKVFIVSWNIFSGIIYIYHRG